MDRSFLSNARLIEASRNFVCIRLATYEDAEEAEFLKQIFSGRSGELENTVFCLLGPDGNEHLSKSGRAPDFAFRTPDQMADTMDVLTLSFPLKSVRSPPVLPQMKSFRLGLNVAECDSLPCVVCKGQNDEQLKSMRDKLAPLAFSEKLAGRFVYASSSDEAELEVVTGEIPKSGYLVITPGEFGIDGQISKAISADAPAEEIAKQLAKFAGDYQRRNKDHGQHVRNGHNAGIDWQTEIPVTDAQSVRAKDRGQKEPSK